MGVGDSVTARVPALECQQERAGSQESGLLGFSYFLPLSRPSSMEAGGADGPAGLAQLPIPPVPSPPPESPPQGAGKPFRPWLSLGVGKKVFSGLRLQSGFISADEIRNKEA